MVIDWVQLHVEIGDYDAQVERDGNSIVRQGPPKLYRYELQGPNALALVEKLIGGPVPPTKFFDMTTSRSPASPSARSGTAWPVSPASSSSGRGRMGTPSARPSSRRERPRPRPGRLDGLLQCQPRVGLGALAPARDLHRRGHGRLSLLARRRGAGSLAGSLLSENIEDYYVTPYDLGYGRSVAFDHDFIGRAALEQHAENQTRTKVTLVWNSDDVAAAIGSLFQPGTPAKYMALPKSRYGLYQADEVQRGGKPVGISMDCGYMANEQVFASLATIDSSAAETGTEVTVTWGEDPNTRKPQVEPHRQVTIRATVAPAPYLDYARSNYRDR